MVKNAMGDDIVILMRHYYKLGTGPTETRRLICQAEGPNMVSTQTISRYYKKFKEAEVPVAKKETKDPVAKKTKAPAAKKVKAPVAKKEAKAPGDQKKVDEPMDEVEAPAVNEQAEDPVAKNEVAALTVPSRGDHLGGISADGRQGAV